jgi:hypothetical protein
MGFDRLLERVCETNEWTMTSGEIVVPAERGRTQAFRWKPFQDGTREMARLWTLIGPAGKLTPTRLDAALSLNFNLPFGALALIDGNLGRTVTFLVPAVDEEEIEFALRSMAEVADRYERLIYGGDAH